MKKRIHYILLSSVLFTTTTVSAQFILSGEIRPRAEYLHGVKALAVPNQEAAFWVEQRSRLAFDYTHDRYRVGIIMQDIRTWGSTSQLNKSDEFSAIHQAWAQVLFCNKLSLKFGRQEVGYDDQRVLGSVGWAQQSRSHDLAILKYKDSTLAIDLGLAFNQNSTQLQSTNFTVPKNYKTLQFLHIHKDFSPYFKANALILNNGIQHIKTDTVSKDLYTTKYSHTAGLFITYKKDKLKASFTFYNQSGTDGNGVPLRASNTRGVIQYTLNKFTLGAGYEYLSGTSQVDTLNKENNSFAPFYGTNHKFNGFMDYFYVGNHANTVGLQDLFFSALFKHKKLSSSIHAHLFYTAANLLDLQELNQYGKYKALNSRLGTEIDLTFKYPILKQVDFQAGYSHMFATKSMEALKGGRKEETNHWAYFMISIKPVFFESN